MGWDQGMSHRRKRAFTAVFLVVAIVSPATAQRRIALMPSLAQNPIGSKPLPSGDDWMNGLDKALQAARLDERTSKAIITIVGLLPEKASDGYTDRKSAAQAISLALNVYAKDLDGWDSTGARNLDNAGAAVAAAFLAADRYIYGSQYYYHVDLGRETLAAAATAMVFRDLSTASLDALLGMKGGAEAPVTTITRKEFHDRIADPEQARMTRESHPHYELYFTAAIERARIPDPSEGTGPRFKTEPDGLAVINIIKANPGIEPVTTTVALIELNGRAGDRTDLNHVELYAASVNLEYRRARNEVPGASQSPYPLDEVLAKDIAQEARKFSGPNLAKLTDTVAALTAHAAVDGSGNARTVTREDIRRNLEQLRHGSPPEAAQAKAVLRSWLLESVDYQLRHPQAAAR